jgi:hypothetical protein
MADIFQDGQQGSKAAFMNALQILQAQGAAALKTIETGQLETLVEFDRRLQGVNGRRILAWRVNSNQQALKFIVTDFTDIDQANTTCTMRVDSASVTLKERSIPAEAVIKSNNFSANIGTIETLNSDQTILRVHTDNGATPTGEFDIELVTPLTINHFIMQIVASPSQPTIVVTVSRDGLTYTSATQISINGYTVNVWLPSTEVRFIRIQITPSHPDDLNGTAFTFGITNFSAQSTEYHLRSELLTNVLQFVPKSEFVVFNAVSDPNIQYYLSVFPDGDAAAAFVEVNPGDEVKIGTEISTTVTTSGGSPNSLGSIPSDTYLNTIKVTEGGVKARIAPGLLATDPNLADLTHEYVAVIPTSIGYDLKLLHSSGSFNPPRTFKVSYVFGPQIVDVQLKVRLSTLDPATSPIFHGASLDEV